MVDRSKERAESQRGLIPVDYIMANDFPVEINGTVYTGTLAAVGKRSIPKSFRGEGKNFVD